MIENNQTDVTVFSPALPKGGGSIHGMEDNLITSKSDGMVHYTIPIPLTKGRTITPSLNLSYDSGVGNGLFGIGWQLSLSSIRRRTAQGFPLYTNKDSFLGPDGGVLVPELNEQGRIITRITTTAQGEDLNQTFNVTRYYPRIETDFSQLEYWQSTQIGEEFWLVYSADGVIHCYGKNEQARISHPDDSAKIAEWLLEESLSPYGEHIYYQYKQEDTTGITNTIGDITYSLNRYIKYVYYGNKEAYSKLYVWSNALPSVKDWLYTVVFDYGEHVTPANVPSPITQQSNWLTRLDCFSRFDYGFELRTCRLCQQVLIFHQFDELGGQPELVLRIQLEYEEDPAITKLSAVQKLAYRKDRTLEELPPIEFDYSQFTPNVVSWDTFPSTSQMNIEGSTYQLIDLYGEGVPGILYQDRKCWYYRAPTRQNSTEGQNLIVYNTKQALSQIPALQKNGVLIDLNGDGYLEWFVVQAGISGSYTMHPNRQWTSFIPMKSVPIELFDPQAQLTDLTGSPFGDLVMIGPKSVRFYAGGEDGFTKAKQVLQKNEITLPFNGVDEHEVVAFSDILGTGNQHLVRVRYDGVTCWPNKGFGIFGAPRELPGFSITKESFNPNRVYLADMDGTGTMDLLYAKHDCILFYKNESGNGFAAPQRIALPEGVKFDDLCSLMFADLDGTGFNDLILNLPYKKHNNYCLRVSETKPYLLTTINNNLGMETSITYRSSAQYWLDEKKDNQSAVSALPFSVNVISMMKVQDENTGYYLEKKYTYLRGVYNAEEREYMGFGKIDRLEMQKDVNGNSIIPPTQTSTWYHTGRKVDEKIAKTEYWREDPDALMLESTYFTIYDKQVGYDIALERSNNQQIQYLYHSLAGMLLHEEVYPVENDNAIPFVINSKRYQVRIVQNFVDNYVVLPLLLEELTYNYEKNLSDPQCSQQINHIFDEYGYVVQCVSIDYPRRHQSSTNPYLEALSDSSWDSSYDEQQEVLRITRERHAFYHVTGQECRHLGIPHQTRKDAFIYPANAVLVNGINAHSLSSEGVLPMLPIEHVYGGQTEHVYVGEVTPDVCALLYYTRTAVMDEETLQVYADVLSATELQRKLAQSGYVPFPQILGSSDEPVVYVAEIGFTEYSDASCFYQMKSQQNSQLTGKQIYTWDAYYCSIVETIDALDNRVKLTYDYRFLQPYQMVDYNQNVSQVEFDAFGRVIYSWNWGIENKETIGFQTNPLFTHPKTMQEALAIKAALPVASYDIYQMDSWMGCITLEQVESLVTNGEALWQEMVRTRLILQNGKIRARGRGIKEEDSKLPVEITSLLLNAKSIPVHMASFTADRYPDDPTQQICGQIVYIDGFGRTIQTVLREEAGVAYVMSDGQLTADASGRLVEKHTDTRWSIIDSVVYSIKGAIIQEYEPFFINHWQFINNDTIHTLIDTTTYTYDALEREICVTNAKGYQRRKAFYPWFVIEEDENDTELGTIYSETPTITTLDNRNLPIRILEYNRRNIDKPLEEYITRNTYTHFGYLKSSIDPRLFNLGERNELIVPNTTYVSTLQGICIYTDSVDSGRKTILINIEGQSVWSKSANDMETTIAYDVLGRKTAIYEQEKLSEIVCRERFVYGETQPNAMAYNLRGRMIRHYDTAGLATMASYSMSGELLVQERQFLDDLDQPSYWQTEQESNCEERLHPKKYRTSWQYSAMNQLHTQTDAKGNQQITIFDVRGQVKSQAVAPVGQKIISINKKLTYNAAGQKIYEEKGNGLMITYIYETSTQRLQDIITERLLLRGGKEIVQNLHYEYDAVGNIVEIENKSDLTQYYCNQMIEPKRSFTYDTLYQLITATGRESNSYKKDMSLKKVNFMNPVDEGQYVNYKRTYHYDRGKNLTQIKHNGANSYVTNIAVSEYSNRAVLQEEYSHISIENSFDVEGNLQALRPNIPAKWNARNQLAAVSQVQREAGNDDKESYTYDGNGYRIVKRTSRHAANTTHTTTVLYLPGLEIRTKQNNVSITESLQVIAADGMRFLNWENDTQPNGIANNQYRYSIVDNIDSHLLEFDQNANIISKEEYYPFGGTAIWATRSDIEAEYKTIRYSGKERDATGLYYYGYRYYIPWIGRWINPDPIGTLDGLNTYCMVGNNPVTTYDIEGLVGRKHNKKHRAEKSGVPSSSSNRLETNQPTTSGTPNMIHRPEISNSSMSSNPLNIQGPSSPVSELSRPGTSQDNAESISGTEFNFYNAQTSFDHYVKHRNKYKELLKTNIDENTYKQRAKDLYNKYLKKEEGVEHYVLINNDIAIYDAKVNEFGVYRPKQSIIRTIFIVKNRNYYDNIVKLDKGARLQIEMEKAKIQYSRYQNREKNFNQNKIRERR